MMCFAVSHACVIALYSVVGCEQNVGSGRWVLRNTIDVFFDMGIIIGYYAYDMIHYLRIDVWYHWLDIDTLFFLSLSHVTCVIVRYGDGGGDGPRRTAFFHSHVAQSSKHRSPIT
jgi:hypothetical protein